MSENEYMDFEPPIPAIEGWRQMHALLDEHMPAQPKKKPLVYLWLAAALLVLLLTTIPLKEPVKTNLLSPALHGATTAANLSSYTDTLRPASAATEPARKVFFLPVVNVQPQLTSPKDSIANLPVVNDSDLYANNIDAIIQKDSAETATTVSPEDKEEHSADVAASKSIVTKKSKWSILAGASVNVVTSEKTKNFQPYPSAEVRYSLNKLFFIGGGLSVLSPVTTSTTALEKTYLLNDTLNNVKLYNASTVYKRFYYADVPITFGINVTKKISVSAGMQASVLLFSSSYNKTESYDFMMNRVDMPPSSMLVPLAVVTPQTYEVENKKIEYRYIVGAAYESGRFSLNAYYQHALAPAVKGEYIQTKKNDLFSIGLKYRIK